MDLSFRIGGQMVSVRPHPPVVADSRGYLTAQFIFSDDWSGVSKTAVFKSWNDTVYHVLLTDDACAVPAEVIAAPYFQVSVFGGDRITTDSVTIEVLPSGCEEGVTPPAPTPDIYDQLVQQIAEQRTLAQQAAAAAAAAAEEAEQAVSTGGVQVDNTVTAAGVNAVSGAAVYGFVSEKTAAVYRYKGTVATYIQLAGIAEKETGDVYNVEQDGMNVAWTGTSWDKLGAVLPIDMQVTAGGVNAVSGYAVNNFVNEKIAAKQDTLTFDQAPTAGSTNPVTSGGVYNKFDTWLTHIDVIKADKSNVYSKSVVDAALAAKQDTLTFDQAPTADSQNPVTSGGVYAALQNVGGGGGGSGVDTSWTQIGYVSADTEGAVGMTCTCAANTYTEYMVLIYAAQAATAGSIACRINGQSTMQFSVPAKTNAGFYAGAKITSSPFGSFLVSGAAVAAYNSSYANSFAAFDNMETIVMAMSGGIPAGTTCTVWGRF